MLLTLFKILVSSRSRQKILLSYFQRMISRLHSRSWLKFEHISKVPRHPFQSLGDELLLTRLFTEIVAYKRFGDNVPKQIDADFVRGIDAGLDIALMTMDLSKDKCIEYLQEPATIVTERKELTGKKERLQAAQQKLSRFYDEQGVCLFSTSEMNGDRRLQSLQACNSKGLTPIANI